MASCRGALAEGARGWGLGAGEDGAGVRGWGSGVRDGNADTSRDVAPKTPLPCREGPGGGAAVAVALPGVGPATATGLVVATPLVGDVAAASTARGPCLLLGSAAGGEITAGAAAGAVAIAVEAEGSGSLPPLAAAASAGAGSGTIDSRGISNFEPHLGQIPRLPARNDLTFSLCPFGQRNLIPMVRHRAGPGGCRLARRREAPAIVSNPTAANFSCFLFRFHSRLLLLLVTARLPFHCNRAEARAVDAGWRQATVGWAGSKASSSRGPNPVPPPAYSLPPTAFPTHIFGKSACCRSRLGLRLVGGR